MGLDPLQLRIQMAHAMMARAFDVLHSSDYDELTKSEDIRKLKAHAEHFRNARNMVIYQALSHGWMTHQELADVYMTTVEEINSIDSTYHEQSLLFNTAPPLRN